MTQAVIRAETADISAKLRELTQEDRRWLDGVIVGLTTARTAAAQPPAGQSGA